jgi:hypothetical protein
VNTINSNSGILDVSPPGGWLAGSHVEPNRISSYDLEPSQLIDDLILASEVNIVVRNMCLSVLARFGLTSWGEGGSGIKFWCNGVDAILRWDVSPNPINRLDPPFCLLSVKLGADDTSPVLYGCVVAELSSLGLFLLCQTVRSIILHAVENVSQ